MSQVLRQLVRTMSQTENNNLGSTFEQDAKRDSLLFLPMKHHLQSEVHKCRWRTHLPPERAWRKGPCHVMEPRESWEESKWRKVPSPSPLITINRFPWRHLTSFSADIPWWKDPPKKVSGWEMQRCPEHDWPLCPTPFKDCSEEALNPGYCRKGSFSVSRNRECPALANGQHWKLTQRVWLAAGLLMHSQVFM